MGSKGSSEKRHCPNGHYDGNPIIGRIGTVRSVRKEALPKRALRPQGLAAKEGEPTEGSEKRHCPNGHYDDFSCDFLGVK